MDLDLASYIRDVPDFPKKGILFKDITTLLKDPAAFRASIDRLSAAFHFTPVDVVVGMESRGFIFGAPLAYNMGAGFVPVRKLGKLPAETLRVEYALEYGTNTLEIHTDAIAPGQRVLVVDDLLATGGTVAATIELIRRLGGEVVGLGFLVELLFLNGRGYLGDDYEIVSLVQY
ncbi:MAG: adenine phosphoribosyltransferase [Chloroflexota bacterium]